MLIEARQLLEGRPRLLGARSSSKVVVVAVGIVVVAVVVVVVVDVVVDLCYSAIELQRSCYCQGPRLHRLAANHDSTVQLNIPFQRHHSGLHRDALRSHGRSAPRARMAG